MSKSQKKSNCGKSQVTTTSEVKSSLDRFGDDLTELIVSYLSITDKIRFECLSKQIQSLVYNKQNSLRITLIRSADNLTELILKPSKTSRYQSVNHSAFGAVLKKLKFLRSIRIEGRMTVDSQLIHTIAENCQNLKHLWITVRFITDISAECLKVLAQRLGPTLQSLKFDGLSDKQMRQLLSSCPELQLVMVDNIKTVVTDSKHWNKNFKKFLPKLQEIQFCRCTDKMLNQFQTEYSENMLKVKTHLLTLDLRSEAMTRALTGFGRFKRLQALDLFVDVCDESDVQSIENGLRQMATDLNQLKQLSFTLDGNLLQNNNLFSIFGNFKILSSLEINIIADLEMDDNNAYNYGSIRELKHLTQLKHLSLTLEQLTDDCLENIDKYLPNLVSIRVNTTKAITDKTLRFLTLMKCLTRLEIICFTTDVEQQNISDSGVQQLIQKSVCLTTLLFDQKNSNADFAITERSIEEIASRAKQMPKNQYNFSFAVNNTEKSNQLIKRLTNLPTNLSIEIL